MCGRGVRFLKKHSLSLALMTLLVSALIFQYFYGYPVWVDDQLAHHEPIERGAYNMYYISESVLSLEADVFGAFLLVFLTKFLWEKGSAESNGE